MPTITKKDGCFEFKTFLEHNSFAYKPYIEKCLELVKWQSTFNTNILQLVLFLPNFFCPNNCFLKTCLGIFHTHLL
jgi:hypothetical protein